MRRALAIAALATAALGWAPQLWAQERAPLTAPPDRRVDLDFQRYYTGEQLQAALESMGSAYPEFLRLESMGKSRGGRELWVVTLAARDGDDPARKGAVLVVGGLGDGDPHGVEMALFTLYEMALNHARDPAVEALLATATVYFVPCLDPDARARLLEPPSDASAPPRAIVLDRNFPAGWSPWEGGVGGAYPLSEPETRALTDFLTAHPNVAVVQTYSQAARADPAAAGVGLPEPDVALHELLLAYAAKQLEEPEHLVAASALHPAGGSLLGHVVGERGALGFTSRVAGRTQRRLPQVQDLFPLARRASRHTLLLARSLPRLAIASPSVTRLRNELWQVDVAVVNEGLFATAGTLARARRLVLAPRFEVSGAKLVAVALATPGGEGLRPLPEATGSIALPEIPGGGRVELRLVVSAPAETSLTLSAEAPRAGRAGGTATLR